jgi:hypothetical protein
MNPFLKTAQKIREGQEYPGASAALIKRIETEGKIVNKLVKQAIASGYRVSVNDGEEWVVEKSVMRTIILDAMFSTDEDVLVFYKPKDGSNTPGFDKVGFVQLIYGNGGYDVIGDYGSKDLEAFTAWMKPIDAYADTLA